MDHPINQGEINQGDSPSDWLKNNEKGNHCLITFNVDLPSDENSPNHNSNTTASIKEKQDNENFLYELWAIISIFFNKNQNEKKNYFF